MHFSGSRRKKKARSIIDAVTSKTALSRMTD